MSGVDSFASLNRLRKLKAFLRLSCPVCGNGPVFSGYCDTPDRCRYCGYYFMRESGYFLPHVVIGYAATIAAALGSWPALHYLGLRSAVPTLAFMVAVSISFGIWSLRYAKMAWVVLDLYFHPPSKEDFESRGR
jgi:uncharacterized protein (DUF983 family)